MCNPCPEQGWAHNRRSADNCWVNKTLDPSDKDANGERLLNRFRPSLPETKKYRNLAFLVFKKSIRKCSVIWHSPGRDPSSCSHPSLALGRKGLRNPPFYEPPLSPCGCQIWGLTCSCLVQHSQKRSWEERCHVTWSGLAPSFSEPPSPATNPSQRNPVPSWREWVVLSIPWCPGTASSGPGCQWGLVHIYQSHFSRVWLFVILRIVARQVPLSMGFSRQEYWSGLPCPPPGDLPDPGIEAAPLMSPALTGRFFTTSTTGKPQWGLSLPSVMRTSNSGTCSDLMPGAAHGKSHSFHDPVRVHSRWGLPLSPVPRLGYTQDSVRASVGSLVVKWQGRRFKSHLSSSETLNEC